MSIPVRWIVCGIACIVGFCVGISALDTTIRLAVVGVAGMVAVATADRP